MQPNTSTNSRHSYDSGRAVRFGVSREKSVAEKKKSDEFGTHIRVTTNTALPLLKELENEREKKVVHAKWQSQRGTKLPNENLHQNGREIE